MWFARLAVLSIAFTVTFAFGVGCAPAKKPLPPAPAQPKVPQWATSRPTTNQVAQQVKLGAGSRAEPVLIVKLEISANGAKVLETREDFGLPTVPRDKSGPITLRALSAKKESLHLIAIGHPLEVTSAGTKNTKTEYLKSAVIYISLPRKIALPTDLNVDIGSGPGKGFHETLALPVKR